jgi:hypothetical protein
MAGDRSGGAAKNERKPPRLGGTFSERKRPDPKEISNALK